MTTRRLFSQEPSTPDGVQALQHPDRAVRCAAAYRLGRSGDPSAVPALIAALRDPDAGVRRAAAEALGYLGDPRAIPALCEALSAVDVYLRQAAERALLRIEYLSRLPPSVPAPPPPPVPVLRVPIPVAEEAVPSSPPVRGALILFVALALLAVLALTAGWLWNRPLGPHLTAQAAELLPLPAAEALPTPQAERSAAAPLCGGPPMMRILVVGLDATDPTYSGFGGFADVIRIARVDFTTPAVTVLAIPRDLWVPIPGMEQYGVEANRLKTAYPYGNRYGLPGGGVGLLMATLATNFGVEADRYVVMDKEAFRNSIDAIGGVDIYLSAPIGGTQPGEPYFGAGWHHLDGHAALAFASLRPDNTSDLYRIQRQDLLIEAVRAKLLSPQTLPLLPRLIGELRGSVSTDLSAAEINRLVCLGRVLGEENLHTITLDPALMTPVVDEYGYERLLPDAQAIARFVAAFNAGEVPANEAGRSP